MRFYATLAFLLITLAVNAQLTPLIIGQRHVDFGYKSVESKREVKALIIHSTFNASFPNAQHPDTFSVDGVLQQFKQYGVAAHYLIGRDGNVYELVEPNNVAYHAGKSVLPDGTTAVNSCSIGIEIMCTYTVGPNSAQYASLRKLIDQLDATYKFKYILGHFDIAPGRKTDPWHFVDNGFFRK
jgi:N-acetyl-anhydromuramyl-L-alanine amidase AmpD